MESITRMLTEELATLIIILAESLIPTSLNEIVFVLHKIVGAGENPLNGIFTIGVAELLLK